MNRMQERTTEPQRHREENNKRMTRNRNTTRGRSGFGFYFPAFLVLSSLCLCASVVSLSSAADASAATDIQDFVFLGDSRPVFVRLHVRTDGKALEEAWNDFMKYLFAYLDVDGDGVLSKAEAERAPAVDQLRSTGQGGGFAAFGGGGAPAGPSMDALDADKDGKVTLAELSAWYRKNGFAPFQFQFSGAQANPAGMAAGMLGGRAEPSAAAVSEAIFALLDTDRDGKLTKEKLAAAPTILLRLDENEDEMIVPSELVPSVEAANPFGAFMMMGGRKDESANNKHVVPITTGGEVPPRLVQMIQERYGLKKYKDDEKKLTRAELGLDEATFAKLDRNSDGVLDADELAGFVNRPADLELSVRLGKKEAAKSIEASSNKGHALADKFQLKHGLGYIDLGKARVDILTSEGSDALDRFGGLAREQYLVQFRQIDTDNKGFINEEQAKKNRTLRTLFKAADRNGDGKLTEKKLIAYLEHLQEMQKRATAACVTLEFSDQNRGLFDLLDTDRDGRLSVREMRNAVKLLEQLDREGKGHITKADIPKMYKMTIRQGAAAGGQNPQAAFFALYGGGYESAAERPGRGPLWFQKMDRNRDGDVSRKEWLWSEELFRKIDTDGDGLISVEEAEAYDKLMRKEGQGK